MAIWERTERFDFSAAAFSKENFSADCTKGFLARLTLKALPSENTRKLLFACPYFEIFGVRLHAERDKDAFTPLKNCARAWRLADSAGFVHLLELRASFLSPYLDAPKEMLVELPLHFLRADTQAIYAYYDGLRIGWVLENEEINQNYPFGTIVKNEAAVPFADESITAALSTDLSQMKKEIRMEKREASFNFYSPLGYDAWAGDVMNFYQGGTYHLLFLHDRHHHASRFGSGAHSVRHFTTRDFLTFEEGPPLVEIDADWKTAGTGTMFFHKGKYYFAYGLHTSRMIPCEQTGSHLMDKTAKSITPVPYTKLSAEGLYPSGANYLVSEDGIQFTQGDRIFHFSENPSVYTDGEGGLFMFGGYGASGIFRAEKIGGKWTLDETQRVPESPLHASTECPSMFSLHGYHYLLMGFTGFWKRNGASGEYSDEAIRGLDVYDGLCVPMVTKIAGERLILAGWVGNGNEWGSVILHRELTQGEDGRLFMKWMPELAPKKDRLALLAKNAARLSLHPRKSYYFELDVDANEKTELLVRFSGEKNAVLSVNSHSQTVQINENEEKLLPLYELIKQGRNEKNAENIHRRGGNFAIGRVDTIQRPYTLKIQLYYEPKSDGTYLDCEIGEKRTIVSNRKDQKFDEISIEVKNGKLLRSEAYAL